MKLKFKDQGGSRSLCLTLFNIEIWPCGFPSFFFQFSQQIRWLCNKQGQRQRHRSQLHVLRPPQTLELQVCWGYASTSFAWLKKILRVCAFFFSKWLRFSHPRWEAFIKINYNVWNKLWLNWVWTLTRPFQHTNTLIKTLWFWFYVNSPLGGSSFLGETEWQWGGPNGGKL